MTAKMKSYRIKNWETLYENNRSRTVKELAWVAIPNRHDGEGFSTIMTHPQAAEIFSAWVLMLQVASRCQPRGSLLRDNGRPHTAESLALKTRGKTEWFTAAFEILSSEEIGWLELIEVPEKEAPAPPRQQTDSALTVPCQAGDEGMEWNGTELNELNELNIPPSPPLQLPTAHTASETNGRREDPMDFPVELPRGFPRTEAEAKNHAAAVGCPEQFAISTWNLAMGRGGRDAKDVPIRVWSKYLSSQWGFARQRLDRAAPQRTGPEPNQFQEDLEIPILSIT